MKTEEILIIAAVAAGIYFVSKGNSSKKQTPAQTSPFSNNPNRGINSGAKTSSIGETAEQIINTGKSVVDVFGKVVNVFDRNNNATGNDSFDALDQMGQVSGGWGGPEDVNVMTA